MHTDYLCQNCHFKTTDMWQYHLHIKDVHGDNQDSPDAVIESTMAQWQQLTDIWNHQVKVKTLGYQDQSAGVFQSPGKANSKVTINGTTKTLDKVVCLKDNVHPNYALFKEFIDKT